MLPPGTTRSARSGGAPGRRHGEADVRHWPRKLAGLPAQLTHQRPHQLRPGRHASGRTRSACTRRSRSCQPCPRRRCRTFAARSRAVETLVPNRRLAARSREPGPLNCPPGEQSPDRRNGPARPIVVPVPCTLALLLKLLTRTLPCPRCGATRDDGHAVRVDVTVARYRRRDGRDVVQRADERRDARGVGGPGHQARTGQQAGRGRDDRGQCGRVPSCCFHLYVAPFRWRMSPPMGTLARAAWFGA